MNSSNYDPTIAYGFSKLGNVLQSTELARRLGVDSTIETASVHPGMVNTELMRHFPKALTTLLSPAINLVMKTPEAGARTSLYCSLSPRSQSGAYYLNCKEGVASDLGQDKELAAAVWRRSCELVNIEDKESL